MRIRALIGLKGMGPEQTWFETHDRADITTDAQALEFMKREVLRLNESPNFPPGVFVREVIEARVTGPTIDGEHEWVPSRGRIECKACGVTARYSLARVGPVRDAQYRAKKYDFCNPAQQRTAQTMMEKEVEQLAFEIQAPAVANVTRWFNTRSDGPPSRPGLYQETSDPHEDSEPVMWRHYSAITVDGLWTRPWERQEDVLLNVYRTTLTPPEWWRGLDAPPPRVRLQEEGSAALAAIDGHPHRRTRARIE